jgi:hypothetical protein
MAHYSRIAERKSETPREWLHTCAQIGQVANDWAGRTDLVVYAGIDAVNGEALAAFYRDTAEIEINLPIAFGKATTPTMVGDLRERDQQFEFPQATGVIYHEALHAKHTTWNIEYLETLTQDKQVIDAFMLLEESRIEGLGAKGMPENKLFLRASALQLALGDLSEGDLEKMTKTFATAHLAGLSLARVDAGVLETSDILLVEQKVLEVLSPDLVAKLREIWIDFQALVCHKTGDLEAGIALATKWVELLKERAEEQGEETGEGEGGFVIAGSGSGEGEGEGEGNFIVELIEALAEDAMETAIATGNALGDQQTQEDWDKETKERAKTQKIIRSNKATAQEVFEQSNGDSKGTTTMPSSRSGSRLVEVRKPTSAERIASVRVAQMLDKAKYRERDLTIIRSELPAGRLRSRALVQNKALESKGIMSKNPAWEHKVRKHTDEPTLSIGVMVDISGSMGSAMNPMATTAWVLGEAGKRIQAKTAMVYYGNDVFATLKVGQKLDEVRVYSATDGTEKFGKGFSALDGTLDLLYGRGARMLVVVSDGCYTDVETENARQAVKACEKNGVAVLWISPDKVHGERWNAREIIKGTHAVLLDGLEPSNIATLIGKSASEALEKATAGF